MGSKGDYLKSSLSSRLKMPSIQTEEWKTSLCFTGDNPLFPVEMFLKIIEQEADKRGLDDNDKVLEVLSRVPDHRPSFDDGNTDYQSRGSSPASYWKRRLLDRQRKRQDDNSLKDSDLSSGTGGLDWEELKCDMISEFGRQPNHTYTTQEKLNLLQSLCKGKNEAPSTFFIRVLTVVSILEDDKLITDKHKEAESMIRNSYNGPVISSKTVCMTDHNTNNSTHPPQSQHQATDFQTSASTVPSTHYIHPYSSAHDTSFSPSRQQYENWLTEQRRLGRQADPIYSYDQGDNKNRNIGDNVTDYSMSSTISNSHMPTQESNNPINRLHPTEATDTIGGQVDGQHDYPDYFHTQKSSVWVRMLLLLGLTRRERDHLMQLGGEIEQKSVIDICSYLTERREMNIKQELPSSSDEYESDDADEDERVGSGVTDANNDGNQDDTFDYQQSLELEMEVGQSAPAIKVNYLDTVIILFIRYIRNDQ